MFRPNHKNFSIQRNFFSVSLSMSCRCLSVYTSLKLRISFNLSFIEFRIESFIMKIYMGLFDFSLQRDSDHENQCLNSILFIFFLILAIIYFKFSSPYYWLWCKKIELLLMFRYRFLYLEWGDTFPPIPHPFPSQMNECVWVAPVHRITR